MTLRDSNNINNAFPDGQQYVSEVGRTNGVSSFVTGENENLRFFSKFFHPDSDEYPWADSPLQPGERTFLNRVGSPSVEDGTVGQPVSFSNPLVIEDGIDLEIVQDYIDMRGDVEVVVWGTKPSASPPYDSENQFEPIAPVFYDGASGVLNVQRVAEPTKRSLLNPDLDGKQAVAATVENRSSNPDPIRGKIYVSSVIRR